MFQIRKAIHFGGVALLLACYVATFPRAVKAIETPLVIAVSTPVIADIVRNVAGDRADEVYSVVPENADPHAWEPSPKDMTRAMESSTFVYMGASLEPFVESGGWRRAVDDAGIPVLMLSEYIDLIQIDETIDHGDHVHDLRAGDPHVWLNPRMVLTIIAVIETHLAMIDPDGSADYLASASRYASEIADLDAELERDLLGIPDDRRKLVVFHDAYRYFAARFDFEVIGVVLPNLDGEPAAQDIVDLLSIIDQSGVGVVFAEPQFGDDVLSLFEAESQLVVGMLMSDSFTNDVSTYVELMRFNRDSLVAHLSRS